MGHGQSTFGVIVRVYFPFVAAYFLSYLFRNVNAVIAPDLTYTFALTASTLGLLTSAYFLGFAAFQLPLGVLLDRYGPRRVDATLFVLAAVGGWVFATAQAPSGLFYGRALIGIGVSAALMAAFHAFSLWLPRERLPLANSVIMAAGTFGALFATVPVERALDTLGWRGIYMGLGGAAIAASALLWFLVPKRVSEGKPIEGAFTEQAAVFWDLLKSPVFWRIAPVCIACQGAFLSLQGLWVGPWFHDVIGLDRAAVAEHLAVIPIAMVIGYLVSGGVSDVLARRGIQPTIVLGVGVLVFLLVQLTLVMGITSYPLVSWAVFGFAGTASMLCYAILIQSFPAALTGRVLTLANVMVFGAAFAFQWGIGVVLAYWPVTIGKYAPQGYQVAFGVVLGIQTLAYLWFLIARASPGRSDRALSPNSL